MDNLLGDIIELIKARKKLEFKPATLLAVSGISFVIEGTIFKIFWLRMVGYIIATAGMVSMGKRLYGRIQEKAKQKAKRIKF